MIGLLCDEQGEPVSNEVLRGNTRDLKMFGAQVSKAAEWFGCQQVTLVGERGMIKRAQLKELREVGFPLHHRQHQAGAGSAAEQGPSADGVVFQRSL